ncbi:vesicle transport through interaction with t-SNAREs homolog 1B-like [Frieseomelitta varia]|uniref:vesicle transport through interaction with t-SNAREs homolog 1B-like n=1 Tax=Frieseomelitta varia TaxID=561572 RepID=UPI001CB68F99|nr:vesicle transport through interaction with t-SNAREs homolog 1B-like [Frieseomelitta varia]XP_043514528.1 vesicle transport through interaction with t-SNAREs homolog 1B-like [Frieseomelitta varia]
MNFGVNWEEEHRRTLLEGNAALERTSQSIIRSQAIAIESEQIGTEVISELSEQRERLLRADRRLSQTDEELNKTRRILNVMRRRILMNKFILIIIILLEIGILGAIIYKKYS